MKINSLQIRTFSKLGMHKSFFGMAMPEVLKERPDVYVMTADLGAYSGMDRIARMYPRQIVNVGIQEQNMIGVACGLALEGKTVFASSYASFALVRAMEQVRHNMSILHQNIKLIGYMSGYSLGTLGKSHWATEDLAFTRCLPGMTVISPADALEAVKVCQAVSDMREPVYIRLYGAGDAGCQIVYPEDYEYQIGKAIKLKEGKDTMILATGRMVAEGLRAAEKCAEMGISVSVVNVHTIKPLDEELIEEALENYERIYTAEEHNIIGGLGSAVAEVMSRKPRKASLHRFGMQDKVYKIGSERYIWEQAGICAEQMAEKIQYDLKS